MHWTQWPVGEVLSTVGQFGTATRQRVPCQLARPVMARDYVLLRMCQAIFYKWRRLMLQLYMQHAAGPQKLMITATDPPLCIHPGHAVLVHGSMV